MLKKIKRVEVLIELEKYKEAQKKVEKILKEDYSFFMARYYELIISQYIDNVRGQYKKIDKFIADFPEEGFGYYRKACVLLGRNRKIKAKKMAEKALSLDPFNVKYLSLVSLVYLNMDAFKKADELNKRVLEEDPYNYSANYIKSELDQKWNRNNDGKNLLELNYCEHSILHEAEKLILQKKFDESLNLLRDGIRDFPISKSIRETFLLYKALSSSLFKYLFFITKFIYVKMNIYFVMGLFLWGIFRLESDNLMNPFWVVVILILIIIFHINILILKYIYRKKLKAGKI